MVPTVFLPLGVYELVSSDTFREGARLASTIARTRRLCSLAG
ncbi:MAG: hypothetical protein AB1806_14995 [Acidobacteriota bacterium]